MTFCKDSAICKNWRCGVQVTVWMIWYFLQKYSRSHIYRLWGGDLPEPHGCPVNIHTIGLYLRDMTERVGAVGFRKLLTYRLSGKVQVDESFVRTPRKHNVGRIVRNRTYTLVINSCVGPQVLSSWGFGVVGSHPESPGGSKDPWSVIGHDDATHQVLVSTWNWDCQWRMAGVQQFATRRIPSCCGCT